MKEVRILNDEDKRTGRSVRRRRGRGVSQLEEEKELRILSDEEEEEEEEEKRRGEV